MIKLKYLFTIFTCFLSFNANAALKKKPSSSVIINKKLYLGKRESRILQKELIKKRITDETFVLNFMCDKYKRTSSSKKRSINCLAVSISPDPNYKTAKKEKR